MAAKTSRRLRHLSRDRGSNLSCSDIALVKSLKYNEVMFRLLIYKDEFILEVMFMWNFFFSQKSCKVQKLRMDVVPRLLRKIHVSSQEFF